MSLPVIVPQAPEFSGPPLTDDQVAAIWRTAWSRAAMSPLGRQLVRRGYHFTDQGPRRPGVGV